MQLLIFESQTPYLFTLNDEFLARFDDMLVDCLTNEFFMHYDLKEKRRTNQKLKNETHVELYPCATCLV